MNPAATALVAQRFVDPAAMDDTLRPFLGAPIESAEVLGGKPGDRAVIRYRGGGSEVYGKVYAHGTAAVRTWDLLGRLGAVVPVPRPLALVEERGLVLYAPITGASLDELVGRPALDPALEGAGRWLGTLHGADVPLDRVLDPTHEAANARVWAETVTVRAPRFGAAVRALADAIASAPPSSGSLVPVHKDFQYGHVVVGDPVGAVDLDEARLGDPAFDVAHFCTYLELLAHRTGGDATRWRTAFVRGYGFPPDAERMRWFTAYTCVKIAKQLVTGRGPAPVPAGASCAAEVELVVARGSEAVA